MLWAHGSRVSRLPKDRCSGITPPDKMPTRAPWQALSVVLILLWGHPRATLACPHPCACYVPSEVHCTFRSLASVPAGISKHVERINLGFNSIQALSETSFAGLTKLELLMIHGNDIPSIPDGALRDLTSLQVFKFSYNKLRVITGQTLQGLWNLMRLHVDHNKIEFIHPQAFSGLTSLRLVHLEGNMLQQLHPATFSTFSFLDYFRLSTVRHLYLAENRMRTLPAGMLQNMPLLENLYLHGNPWSCDCEMRWFLEWDAKSKGILKCKKDKAYEGGQLCSVCSSPEKLHKQEIQKLKDITCQKPSIESPLRQNRSRGSEEEQDAEEDSDNQFPLEGFQYPPWNVSLNMSDEHGNTVSLACDIKKPMDLYKIHLNQTDPQELEINATVALDFECPMTRETYEKLWKLIAYYSEVPVKLHRELALGKDPRLGYQYRQDADDDTLYYTGVRAHVLTEPEWVMQPSIHIQLNRRQSTAKTVLLSYSSQHALTVSAKDARQARSRSWVMIEPGRAVQRAQTVLEGSPCQLSCNVKASESPSIFWVFPDGSVLKAPVEDEHGRFSILTSGWLKIKSTEQSDAGLYQCIARVRGETDRMVYRVLVQTPATPPPNGHTVTVQKDPGESVMLPCRALAIPEAQISWILPNRRIVNDMANTSHAYMLADGTLSIPKVQGSDSGYYRCVAVNQQGADHFTVGVTVHKKGSGRSSKRGRRPGGKTLPGGRGDVVEDEGGSGMADGDNVSRTVLLHPKDQEMSLKTEDDGGIPGGQKAKKGRRKMKPWKSSEKEPETNVAEGRRVFEARRRINVANKQINPEHWADILARVRGRNPPKGTEVPPVVKSTTLPAVSQQVTSLSPAVRAPSASPVRTATSVEESSGDAPFFGEEKQASSAVSSTKTAPVEHGHDGAIPAEPHVTSTRPEGLSDDEFSAKTKAEAPTAVDLKWAASTTAYQSSATRSSLGVVHGEPTTGNEATGRWSARDAGAEPERTPKEYESPLDATSLAESETVPSSYPDLETNSAPGGAKRNDLTTTDVTAAPTPGVADSRMPEPLEDPTLGEPGVPAEAQLQEQTDDPQLLENGSSPQGHPLMEKGREGGSQTRRGGGLHEGDAVDSRSAESRRRGAEPSPPLDPALEVTDTVAPFQHPRGTTRGPLWDAGATTVATMLMPPQTATSPPALTSHASRKRPNGRRRLRPHRFRQRHRQNQPTTLSPGETFSAPPTTRVPEMQTPNQAASLPVPATAVDSTAGTAKQLDVEKHTEPASKGTYARRKHGKRPNKHRYPTSTDGPPASASKPSPAPEERHKHVVTPSSEAVPSSTAISLPTGGPREMSRVEDYRTTTTKVNLSHDKLQGTIPVSDGREIKNYEVTTIRGYETDRLVPGESITDVASPSGAEVSTVGGFKAGSCPFGFEGNASCNPPTSARPERLRTDRTVASSSKTLTDSPLLKELQDVDSPAEFSPLAATSALLPQEDVTSSTPPSSVKLEASSNQAETSLREEGHPATTPAMTQSEIRPQSQVSPPSPAEQPASPSVPPTTPVSLAQTSTNPTPLTPRPSPTSRASKDNAPFNHVGVPGARTPSVPTEGTPRTLRPNEFSSRDKPNFTPKQELGKEAFDGRTKNVLPPRGPDASAQVFQPPARVPDRVLPPRGTVRPPPPVATQSSLRHFVPSQAPRHLTSKPEATASPSRARPEHRHVTTPKWSSTTAPVVPLPGSKPDLPSSSADRAAGRFSGKSKLFGSNSLPDVRDPAGKPPSARAPHYSNGRLPFFFNRTLSFPQLGVTPKPQIPTSPAPAMRERKVNPGPYNRIHSQSVTHVDFGPPAPPVLHPPRTAAPPSTNVQSVPLVYSTRSPIPTLTPSVQPSRSFHQSSSKLFSAGGLPASKFWVPGEKPQIVTKFPQTVSVIAETDVVFPCEATGKPKPFVTWTKVSTGALMTPHTRVQRFEVLKNGTFVIRNVQVQDRGQYVCTAKNLHGADRMVVLLSVTVQQPQILASHYKDVTVYLGDTIAMECLAKGTPAPQISWIFPDRRVWQTVSPVEGRITLHENRTLSIKEASFADRGVYKCVASNAAGADSLAIRLHVAALPPVIHQERLENISLPPGLSIHIHCSAKAAPLPSVRWVLWDGTQIRPSQFVNGNLFVFPNGTLYIRNLAPKDSGRYECVAANLVGSARRTVQLTVQRAAANARITGTSPQRTDVRYGGTLQLDCSASGDPWPRILWRLPSKRMIDALFSFDSRIKVFANGTLVVKSVTDKDAGDYLCVARNKVGDDFVVLKVNVVMKPAKIEHKEENDHRVFYGGDLKVDCVATGLPNPEISWSLPDGSLVNSFVQSDDSGGRTKRYVVFNNGTLYFNEVGLREEGDYTCFAENQVGKDEMRVRVKVVTEPAAIRNKTYSVVHVPYGDVVTVACEAKGEPTPRVTWLSPTNRLVPTSSEKYQIFPDGTLLIQKAQRSDSGNYTCVVRNSAGEDRKMVWIHVDVQPPKINGNPNAITTVREIAPGGSRKLIDCRAEGIPTPRVFWAFPEGVVLPAPYYGNRITIHRNGTLDMRSLRKSDSVQLACIGRNEGGEARLMVQLTVLEPVEKPVFHDPVSEKITAMAGHTISLNCSATGTPTPSLLWVLPNGTELQSGQQLNRFFHKGDGRLHISGLSSVDAGAYRCVARNSAGYTERLVSLKVGLKPETSNQYHNLVSIINGETLQLPCTPPGRRQARSSWTLPNGLVLEGPQTRGRFTLWENGTLTVLDASVFDRGTYVCKTHTEYGPSVVNVPVIVIAYPPRITSEPTPVIYTRPGSTVKMNCMAMGIPKAEITWELPDRLHLTAGTQARLYGNRFLHPQGSLTIQQATQRDAGFYKCTAKNILGSDSKTTYIHVY